MRNRSLLGLILLLFTCLSLNSQTEADTSSTIRIVPTEPIPRVQLQEYKLIVVDDDIVFNAPGLDGVGEISINGEQAPLIFKGGQATLNKETDAAGELMLLQAGSGKYQLFHAAKRSDNSVRLRRIPLWMSILPPLIAILLALLFKEVVVSLFVGIWAGAFIAGGMRLESLYYFVLSFLQVVEKYIIGALNDSGHLSVIIFSLLIGGMVAIISRNGGMAGVVKALSKYAKSPRSAQAITWLLGVAIFFDDYANTLIVGNTMRSVTDKFKISREKLAYIVDSTAAPVAAVAFITTWIGAELGYIDDGMKQIAGFENSTPYAIFISSLKYSFYPILTLSFILMIIYLKRDFGPMLKAEQRARKTGQVSRVTSEVGGHEEELENLDPVKNAPLKGYNAVIPVSVVILMTIFGLVDTGMSSCYSQLSDSGTSLNSQSWGTVWGALGNLLPDPNGGFFMKLGVLIGAADSYVALLWASISGVFAAIFLTLIGRIMRLADTISTLATGFKTMLPALIILTLAWSLATTTEELHTATFLTSALKDSINPYLMPVLIFILSAVIAFSTGSSWSTMAILYPIAIPTTWAICQAQGIPEDVAKELLYNVISVVLAASVLGDHCSPISDTTILSSLASQCNHIDHVRTQLPYALLVGIVSATAGGVSTLLGGGWLICTLLLFISLGTLFFIVWRFGKLVD